MTDKKLEELKKAVEDAEYAYSKANPEECKKSIQNYNDRCLEFYKTTDIMQRDKLSVGDRVMFDKGAEIYSKKIGLNDDNY